jgi:hypothetical protein
VANFLQFWPAFANIIKSHNYDFYNVFKKHRYREIFFVCTGPGPGTFFVSTGERPGRRGPLLVCTGYGVLSYLGQ